MDATIRVNLTRYWYYFILYCCSVCEHNNKRFYPKHVILYVHGDKSQWHQHASTVPQCGQNRKMFSCCCRCRCCCCCQERLAVCIGPGFEAFTTKWHFAKGPKTKIRTKPAGKLVFHIIEQILVFAPLAKSCLVVKTSNPARTYQVYVRATRTNYCSGCYGELSQREWAIPDDKKSYWVILCIAYTRQIRTEYRARVLEVCTHWHLHIRNRWNGKYKSKKDIRQTGIAWYHRLGFDDFRLTLRTPTYSQSTRDCPTTSTYHTAGSTAAAQQAAEHVSVPVCGVCLSTRTANTWHYDTSSFSKGSSTCIKYP